MVQFECPRHLETCLHSGVDLSFLNFSSAGSIRPYGEWRGSSPFECYTTVAPKSSHLRGCDKGKKIVALNKNSFLGLSNCEVKFDWKTRIDLDMSFVLVPSPSVLHFLQSTGNAGRLRI